MTDEPRWLSQQEMAAWLPLLRVVQLLPQALDRQLRDEAGFNHTYYMVLALLSAEPDRRLPMSELARRAALSQSRLTHAVAALEQRGFVVRESSPQDRRVQLAQLTDDGFSSLRRLAPGHVAEVRRRVFDSLSAADVSELRRLATAIAAALEG
ncbi:MAG: MarR family winged helix-turn-helix transcriptional regulator [Actinomycetales bacterium]